MRVMGWVIAWRQRRQWFQARRRIRECLAGVEARERQRTPQMRLESYRSAIARLGGWLDPAIRAEMEADMARLQARIAMAEWASPSTTQQASGEKPH